MKKLLVITLTLLTLGCTKVIVDDLYVKTSKGAVIKIKHLEYYNQEELNIKLSGYGIDAEVEGGDEDEE